MHGTEELKETAPPKPQENQQSVEHASVAQDNKKQNESRNPLAIDGVDPLFLDSLTPHSL